MAREPAACGTFTAYKRHKRNGEPVDEACAQAARDQANDRNTAAKLALSDAIRSNLLSLVPDASEPEPIDELAEARLNLSIVKAAMQAGVPTGMAALSKQYADLVSLVARLERLSKPGVSALDELKHRRAERLAASAN